jgi:tRNA G18 (ribose-2'-O)-methylase SpoU
MPRIPISDLSDPRLLLYRQLKASNETRGSDRFVVEGEKLVYRLLASRFPTESVLVTDRYEGHHASKVPDHVPMYVIPHELIESLVGYNFHRGVLATGLRVPWPDLSTLRPTSHRLTLVVCPMLDKPDNLGTILRIGEAFGVDAVLIGDRCPDALNRRVIRVSMGAAFRLPVYEPKDLPGTVAQLRSQQNIQIIAADAHETAEPLDAIPPPDRLALILGSEAFGLEPEWLDLADRRVTIPMKPGADSLNVAVAAGILLYHFTRTSIIS